MELTHDDVLQILEILDRTDLEYFELRIGDSVVIANRTDAPRHHITSVSAPESEPPATNDQPTLAAQRVPAPAQPATAVVEAREPAATGLVDVPSPMVGVFYHAPEPGAAPFVEKGQAVAQGSTLGLIEVMKMFNGVTAPVAGTVAEILVENEAFVEFGQPLLRLQPDPAP